MFQKLKDHLKKLRADMRPMSFRDKLDHLWTYYKEVLLVFLLAVMVVCVLISSIMNLNNETLSYGVLGNVSCSADGYSYLTEDYFQEIADNPKKQRIYLDSIAFEDAALAEDVDMNYQASMRLLAMVSGKMVDYMFLDHYTMEFYMADDFYMDLTQLLTAEELEALGSRLIYAQPEDFDEMFPVAIDVSDMPYVKENIRTGDNDKRVYLTFAANTERPDNCRQVWDRICAWQPE